MDADEDHPAMEKWDEYGQRGGVLTTGAGSHQGVLRKGYESYKPTGRGSKTTMRWERQREYATGASPTPSPGALYNKSTAFHEHKRSVQAPNAKKLDVGSLQAGSPAHSYWQFRRDAPVQHGHLKASSSDRGG